ncbi:hypothetical protein [Photobacterium leiognathi]|uniref:CopG family transcriptional regulator n=1 Tax=Photobacterium leiognathi TaxID=553611 RepID=A0A2T3M7K8_PHOLE|nr:hypothetical protein [Photobacterium leiognathi]KJF97442.1 hypothetical protein UB34_13085 [Photobacterium leiognathi]PSV88250.1 hypothetical protein CTM89_14835 [Photobacterium leiognathi]
MARNPRIQVPFSDALYQRIENYKIANGVATITDAARELIEFALVIKERTLNDDSRTTRELLEELLAKEYQNETTINQIYLHTVDLNKKIEYSQIVFTKEKLKSFKQKAMEKRDRFLNREE